MYKADSIQPSPSTIKHLQHLALLTTLNLLRHCFLFRVQTASFGTHSALIDSCFLSLFFVITADLELQFSLPFNLPTS